MFTLQEWMHLQQNILAKHPKYGIKYHSDWVVKDLFIQNLGVIFFITTYL